MEDGVTPCRRALAEMMVFDSLPPPFKRFLADYPRGLKATAAAQLLRACDGDVDEAMDEIRAALPVRR